MTDNADRDPTAGIPVATIDMLESTWRSITSAVAGLPEEQWKADTDCPGWSVQDHLAHLVGTERLMQKLPAAPVLSGYGDHVRNPIGQFNEAEVDSRRAMSGEQVLSEWMALVDQRVETLRSADAALFAEPAQTPTGPGTVTDFLHLRVLDCWVHEQDIRRAIGRSGHQSGPAAEHTIDRLMRTLPIVIGKRAATPEGSSVVLRLTGPVERTVSCTVRNSRAVVDASLAPDPVTTIEMDSDTFLVLAVGRRAAADWADRITVTGDRDLGQKVLDNLNMMI